MQAERRFWDHVEKTPTCWNWKLSTDKSGNGACRWNGRTTLARKVAWALICGDVGADMQIVLTCRNRRCVRPDHMVLGQGRGRYKAALITTALPRPPRDMSSQNYALSPRPQPTPVAVGVWEVRSQITGEVFTVQETRFGLVCDCPSPRARCWHMEEVEGVKAA